MEMGVAPEGELGGFSMVGVDYVATLCVCGGSFHLRFEGVLQWNRGRGRKGETNSCSPCNRRERKRSFCARYYNAAKQAGFPVKAIPFDEFRRGWGGKQREGKQIPLSR